MNNLNGQFCFRKSSIIEAHEINHELKFRKSFTARLNNITSESHSTKHIPGHDMVRYE